MEPQKITRAYLIVTNQCQLRCRYCWTKKDSGNMSTDTALAAAKLITANADSVGAIPQINFFGGEPLLRWNEVIVPVIGHIRNTYKKPCDLGITTNCILLDEEKLRFLSDNGVAVLASIDGDRATSDQNRCLVSGASSFDVVVSKVPLLLHYYPNIAARMTLTPETAGSLFEDYRFLLELGFGRVECVPNVFVRWDETQIVTLQEQLQRVADDYIEHFSGACPRDGFHEFERGFRRVKAVNHAYHHEEHRISGCNRCGIGVDAQGAINHLGDIYPCHEANYDTSLRIGNVFTGMNQDKRIALATGYAPEKVRGENCDTCRYDNVCNGGCAIFNYMINKDFNQVPQMECVWKQMLLDECEYILGQILWT